MSSVTGRNSWGNIFAVLAVFILMLLGSCGGGGGDGGDGEVLDLAAVTYREIVSVPGGTYLQKDTYLDSFDHTLSPFFIGKYEVTYELWYAVRQWAVENGYAFQNPGLEGNGGSNVHGNTVNQGNPPTVAKHHPVTYITWRDIIVWCNAYSESSGLDPVYSYGGSVLRSSLEANGAACDGAVCNWTANGFRLPTEGEWQYAASYKDGVSWTPYNHVSGASAAYNETESDSYAWSARNSGYSTQDVGTREPNALGIHDMSGNVWEFCWDYDDDYPDIPQTDYRGPAAPGYPFELRIMRGGCCAEWIENKQIGYRNSKLSTSMANEYSMGFRVARSAE